MNILEGLRTHGTIELYYVFPDGREEVALRRSNTILNSGMDFASKALAGDLQVNGMYFAYDNAAPPVHDCSPPVERTASYYHTVGSGATQNFVRAATLSQPSYEATSAAFNHNRATFVGVTSGSGVLAGAGNTLVDGTSDFYGAALAWLHPTDYQQDILFSAVAFDDSGPATFEKVAGAQLGLRWSINFTL
jgi:hypothetical protein